MTTLQQILTERHSCRAFLPQPIDTQVITDIVALASKTASWCNSQPWSVIATSAPTTAALGEHMLAWTGSHQLSPDFDIPTRYEGVYGERRKASGFALYDSLNIAKDDTEARTAQMGKNFTFFGAPHALIITTPASLGTYGAVDCGGFIANILNAATSMGIASCAQAAPALWAQGLHEFLSIDKDNKIVCAIALGYEDTEHAVNSFRTDRAAAEEILSWA